MARGKRAIETPRKNRLPLILAVLLVVLLAVGGAVRMGLLPLPAPQAQGETSLEQETPEQQDTSFPDEAEEPSAAEETIDPADTALPGEGIRVCVDPGHGGRDPGTHDPGDESRLEKNDVLVFSLVLKSAMEAQGIDVVMTRTDDSFPSLYERCKIANKAKVDYYISIHRNSAASDACGVEIWRSSYSSQEAADLGEAIMAGLESVGIQENRGVNEGSQAHDGDYKVLRDTKMTSLLLEMGFMQNEQDNKLFDEKQQDYAEAITQAVLNTYQSYHGQNGAAASGSAS